MKVGETTQFNVAGGMLFQLGKDVQTPLQYRMVLPNMTISGLGGESGRLYELRTMDWDSDDDKARAYAIVNEAINMVAVQRVLKPPESKPPLMSAVTGQPTLRAVLERRQVP